MYFSAGVGVLVNLGIAFGFRGGGDNLNIRSALLHVLGDAAASAGVIVGGVIMQFIHWYIIDPSISVLIAFMVGWGACNIAKETLHIHYGRNAHEQIKLYLNQTFNISHATIELETAQYPCTARTTSGRSRSTITRAGVRISALTSLPPGSTD